MTLRDVIIIGSGPAGWTAAIYAARSGLQPLLFEGEFSPENQEAGRVPMGQLTTTNTIENYPGFPPGDLSGYLNTALELDRRLTLPPHEENSITGSELVELIRNQAIHFGTETIENDILSVDFSQRPFVLTDSNNTGYLAKTVIVATGASPRLLGIESESRFRNRGLSMCAVCDGALPRFRNKPIAVVGGGDSAVEEAEYLSRFASQIYLIHRRDSLRASPIRVKHVMENPKIKILWNRAPKEILGTESEGVTGLLLESTLDDPPLNLSVSGIFLAIGHHPNTDFLKGQLRLTPEGFIDRPIPFSAATSVPGVFAAGDAADPFYRQAITAAASGCIAALDAKNYLARYD